ncbi:diguanylate cyclase domain-containing protein, partial [Enterobacter chuandaensis]
IAGLPRFTVSIGVARHDPAESIDELFKRVDDALYRAKNDGRNKVLAA